MRLRLQQLPMADLGGVIGELDAKSFREAKRFGYERLAIKR